MYKAASSAYDQTKRLALPPRQVEAMAFSKAAQVLGQAGESESDYRSRISALTFNQKVWTFIQSSMMEETCRLPDSLKADILRLSIFVDKQTFKAMALPKAEIQEILKALIRINEHIARGLLSRGEDREENITPPRQYPQNPRRTLS